MLSSLNINWIGLILELEAIYLWNFIGRFDAIENFHPITQFCFTAAAVA